MSSGTFLMSLALLMTSRYMRNFGRCMVFSFQLFCIAEEDTILSAVGSSVSGLCVRRVSWLLSLFFCIFSLLLPCACALLMDDGAVTGGDTLGGTRGTVAVPGEK